MTARDGAEGTAHPAALLKRYGLRPRRGLGQNFLASPGALAAVIEAAELAPDDAVLEIGPGLGVLTRALLGRSGCVVAVELDAALLEVLRRELGDDPNLYLVEGDILALDHPRLVREHCGRRVANGRTLPSPGEIPPHVGADLRVRPRDAEGSPTAAAAPDAGAATGAGRSAGAEASAGTEAQVRPYKVVANLPYYLTSHALRRLLEIEPRPELIVVMVQREVAERAVAGPGAMSLLALSVQLYAAPQIVARVPAGAFIPRPDVDSAVLRLRVRPLPLFPETPPSRLFAVAAAGFGQRRKSLLNALSSNLEIDKARIRRALESAEIEPGRRAQELALGDWARLCAALPDPLRADRDEPPP